jgi:tetratricopeptide (TPR) repeat protein
MTEEIRRMQHLDAELLHAALAGDLPVKVLMRRLLGHLAELCPECAETVVSLRRGIDYEAASRSNSVDTDLTDPLFVGVFDGAFDRTHGDVTAWAIRVRRERRKARADVRELLRVPAELRLKKIERAQTRYRSRAVAELLLEESRRLVRQQPAEARSLASLVASVLLWTPGAGAQDWARDLLVRAQAWVANTLRVEHELRAADRAFAVLRARMARDVVGEAVHAEVASLEASLRLDQGRYAEARRLLDEAITFHRADGDREATAKVLVQRAMVEYNLGDLATAVVVQREALHLLEGQENHNLFLAAILNLGIFMVDAGKAGDASDLLSVQCTALRQGGVWEWPEAKVLRGRVAFALGDLGGAERLFLAARAELIGRRDAVRAAVASLDLAVLYLAQGKTAELRRMARLMGTIFDSAELESEALAAVVLFQKAVAAESVTEAAIRAWRRQLEVARVRGARPPQAS